MFATSSAACSGSVPVSLVLNKAKGKKQREAPRLTLSNLVSALKSVENRWNDLGADLRFPEAVLQSIEKQNCSSLERLTAVLKHFLQLHPFASWRRIIRALERLEENGIVKHIKTYSEHILDPSLTVENVARVIAATTDDWADDVYTYHLAGELMVPITIQDRIKKQYSSVKDQQTSLAKYWVRMLFNASWSTLAGALHFLKEKEALAICVKDYLDIENDETLTMENLLAAFEGVTKWDEIGYRLRVPTTQQNEIRSSFQTDDEKKEAILNHFLQHNPSPTWREAALALYRMRHHDLVKTLYEKKYLIAPEDQRLLDIFNYTVKQRGYLNQTIMQATIQGNARSGKTSLIKVLQGKHACPVEPSTAVMEESARIELSQSTVLVEGILWTPIEDLHEEANLVVREVMTAEQLQSNNANEDDEDNIIIADTIGESVYPGTVTSMVDSELPTRNTTSTIKTFNSSLFTETFEQGPDNSSILNLFKLAIKKAKLEMTMIKDPWTLYISDIGGQLEFQELVPALTNGPSLHIIVIAAHWGLNNKCPIEYLHKNGQSAVSYKANYTVKENVLLTLATIMSTGQHKQLPKAMFVITFKDLVTVEELLVMDEELQRTVKCTEAYRSGVIEFATESHLCHTINNLIPDTDDIACIRKTVERIGMRNDDYQVRTPYTWLCFSLALRRIKNRVLHYSTCVEAGKQCGIESIEELNAALRFLHYNIGVIRYFSDVPELSDIVIKDPQMLFDCVTELVLNTFTFDRVNYSTKEDFEKKGLFPVEMVSKVSTNSELFTNQKLIAFLMYHHIIAPLEKDGETVKYFLPCSLVHAEIFENDASFNVLPPMVIIFDTGYTPRGIFGFLVSDILTDKGHEIKIVLDVDCIYRDQLTVSVGPYVDKFYFSLHATYIKIDVQPSKIERKFPFGEICCYVRNRVVEALTDIVSKLNYNCKATHSLAFLCPDKCHGEQVHAATILFYRGEMQALKCIISKNAKALPKGHEVWFNEDVCISTSRKRPASEVALPCSKRVEYDYSELHLSSTKYWDGHKSTSDCLTVSQLPLLRVCIWRARVEWENIGTALHIDSSILKAIGLRNHYKPEECFTEVLYYWLCQEPPPTLNVLKKCMMSLSLRESCPRLDEDLERNFNQFELSCPDTSAMDETFQLAPSHLKIIVNTVWRARVKWFDIGIFLLNDVPALECIRTKCHHDPDECVREMFSCWLSGGCANLRDLKNSVQSLPVRENYPGLGRDLENALLKQLDPSVPQKTISMIMSMSLRLMKRS
ncbi:uncharacterized protein LOC135334454 isoform X2 [Halichondria panicea]|uniref:uncharacterized protein LOC135334454 isoform X2 n=1 Tax=Halichondria panicea TaxID=6063 RepID=UPI00312B9B7B